VTETYANCNKKTEGLEQLLKIVALLTESCQLSGGAPYLQFGVNLRKVQE
jgi:hypothetical protein